MSNYELTLILNPELSPAKQKALTEKINKFITNLKGEITEFSSWGKKQLAYPIKKNTTAAYFFTSITMPPNGPAKLSQFLRVEENLLRYLLVAVAAKPLQPKSPSQPKITKQPKISKTPKETKPPKKTTATKTKKTTKK